MTVRIEAISAPPVVPPPPTYNITGLTAKQASGLRKLIGSLQPCDPADLDEVYQQLQRFDLDSGAFCVHVNGRDKNLNGASIKLAVA